MDSLFFLLNEMKYFDSWQIALEEQGYKNHNKDKSLRQKLLGPFY